MATQWSSLSSGHYIHFSNGTFLAAVLLVLLLLLLRDASPPSWRCLMNFGHLTNVLLPFRLCRHMLRNINL